MFETKKIRAEVGMMSLVGVRTDSYPVGFGNYFSFTNGLRSINMWAENLKHAASHYLQDGLVEVDIWTDGDKQWAVVVDERLPEGHTFDNPCFTGCYPPSRKMLLEMGAYYRWDQNDEYRKHTDPENWYEERGWSYKNGIISKSVNTPSRKLKAKWSIETKDDNSGSNI